LIHTFKGQ